jgi:hypothetical protein
MDDIMRIARIALLDYSTTSKQHCHDVRTERSVCVDRSVDVQRDRVRLVAFFQV